MCPVCVCVRIIYTPRAGSCLAAVVGIRAVVCSWTGKTRSYAGGRAGKPVQWRGARARSHTPERWPSTDGNGGRGPTSPVDGAAARGTVNSRVRPTSYMYVLLYAYTKCKRPIARAVGRRRLERSREMDYARAGRSTGPENVGCARWEDAKIRVALENTRARW